jgi:hypothetical protein
MPWLDIEVLHAAAAGWYVTRLVDDCTATISTNNQDFAGIRHLVWSVNKLSASRGIVMQKPQLPRRLLDTNEFCCLIDIRLLTDQF